MVNMVQPLHSTLRAVAVLLHPVLLYRFDDGIVCHGLPVANQMIWSLIGRPNTHITNDVKNVTDKSQMRNVTNEYGWCEYGYILTGGVIIGDK
jgi:hypothetical protein